MSISIGKKTQDNETTKKIPETIDNHQEITPNVGLFLIPKHPDKLI